MAYNIPDHYIDQTPAADLDQATLNKMAIRSCNLQGSFNYERMQAGGWLYSIIPGLEKIHTNKEDLAASMSHNLEFFNTHPFLVTFVMGIVLRLEQNKVDIPTIRAVRVAAMGPLGGIGDAIFWFTLVPILAGITSRMAIQSQTWLAPIIFLVVFNLVQFAARFGLMNWSYKLGTDAIGLLTENAKEFTRAASILGVMVVGGLTSNYGATSIGLKIPQNLAEVEAGIAEELTFINIQELLDGILPNLIPLAMTLILYRLMTKNKWSNTKCIFVILIFALAVALIGNFAIPDAAVWGTIWG